MWGLFVSKAWNCADIIPTATYLLLQEVWVERNSVERCNMSKYIKVEDIKEAFTENIIVSSRETAEEIVRVISAIKHRIIDLPIIEIVRCKDCKHWNDFYSKCTKWTVDTYEQAQTNAEDFCSYGERIEKR